MGTQKNRLDEMVLFSTQNMCLNLWLRKYSEFKARIFLLVDFTNPPTVIFRKVGKKLNLISKNLISFYPPTLDIICFVEKIIYF